MIGKKFTSLVDGKVVEVKDIFEDVVILQDNSKIRAMKLLDKNYFEEYIDPKSFFNNQTLLNTFAQKIKQIPDELVSKMSESDRKVVNESLNDNVFNPKFEEPAILPADPELEKFELMQKYGIKNDSILESPHLKAQKQLEQFKSLLEEIQQENEAEVTKIEANRDEYDDNESYEEFEDYEENKDSVPMIQQRVADKPIISAKKEVQVDPIITMFQNVKRNRDFQINIEYTNKIPRPDFIEMMEDSYNTSIIDFLAEEFTNSILENPSIIKEKIVEEIKRIVYSQSNESESETKIKSNTRPRQKKKEPSND